MLFGMISYMHITTLPPDALSSPSLAAALPLAVDGQITLLAPEHRNAPGVAHMLRPRASLPRIGARSLSVVVIPDPARAMQFYAAYHPQGAPGNAGQHLGLWSEATGLLACMTFSATADRRGAAAQHRSGTASLVRYATCANIPGGASRLLAFWRNANPGVAIVSYSDPRLFTGGMYEALGFRHTRTLKPDYRVYDPSTDTLRHKSAFQRSRLESWRVKLGKDSVPAFDAATDPRTEVAMLSELGLTQVWLPGLLRWDLPAQGRGKYWRWYDALCARGQARTGAKPLGWETHHIRPRAWGGTDEASNLTLLSPREHYIAHLLLARIAPGDRAMLQAAWMMATRAGASPSARRYAALRVEYAALKRKHRGEMRADPAIESRRVAAHAAFWQSEPNRHRVSAAGVAALAVLRTDPAYTARSALAHAAKVCQAVVCAETGEVFTSFTDAARWLHANGHPKACGAVIGQAADPRSSKRLTAYGYHWHKAGEAAPAAQKDGRRTQPGVVRASTGEVFPSAYQAAKAHGGVKHANISRACKTGGTAGGERWHFDVL